MNLETLVLTTPHHAATSKVAAVVANWHDETHAGGFSMCQEQPCATVREVDHLRNRDDEL